MHENQEAEIMKINVSGMVQIEITYPTNVHLVQRQKAIVAPHQLQANYANKDNTTSLHVAIQDEEKKQASQVCIYLIFQIPIYVICILFDFS